MALNQQAILQFSMEVGVRIMNYEQQFSHTKESC
jgi:hypothetical protein